MTRPASAVPRKRAAADANDAAKPSKHPRHSLDAYFSPQVRATPALGNDEHVALNAEQISVLRMVLDDGKSVFFTGSAGTGKSLLLRAIIAALRKKHAKHPEYLAVTASTGMAASSIGGTTIHAWGAITPGLHDIGKLISYVKTCRPAYQRWKSAKVLIIDEVSMVDGHLFDTLAQLAVQLRKKSDTPFGGIQLVVTGDFFQLPPVTKDRKEPFFAFNSDAWASAIHHTVSLTHVFRQKDAHFVALLNEMRRGALSPAATRTFLALARPLPHADGLLPTELFPLRAEVDRANAARLAALPGALRTYPARDTGTAAPDKRARLLDSMPAARVLALRPDAQVMLVKNVDERLVNGSVGRVLGFYAVGVCVKSVEAGGSSSSSKTPSTGGAVRNVQVGPDGRTPLALVQETESTDLQPDVDAPKHAQTTKTKAKDDAELYPLVEFRTVAGSEVVLVVRDEFRAEDGEGRVLARRVQIPLVLAWAMSIHKSQGQTIERVKVDLGKVFEKGQSYVAISRAASMEGLQVLRFDAKKVMAHPKVIEWSKSLEHAA